MIHDDVKLKEPLRLAILLDNVQGPLRQLCSQDALDHENLASLCQSLCHEEPQQRKVKADMLLGLLAVASHALEVCSLNQRLNAFEELTLLLIAASSINEADGEKLARAGELAKP